jgi:hypothetical protein
MASRTSTVGTTSGSLTRAVARNGVIFLIGHFLFRGNEVLWVVLATLIGVVVGASGMWLLRFRSSAPARPVRRTARP